MPGLIVVGEEMVATSVATEGEGSLALTQTQPRHSLHPLPQLRVHPVAGEEKSSKPFNWNLPSLACSELHMRTWRTRTGCEGLRGYRKWERSGKASPWSPERSGDCWKLNRSLSSRNSRDTEPAFPGSERAWKEQINAQYSEYKLELHWGRGGGGRSTRTKLTVLVEAKVKVYARAIDLCS